MPCAQAPTPCCQCETMRPVVCLLRNPYFLELERDSAGGLGDPAGGLMCRSCRYERIRPPNMAIALNPTVFHGGFFSARHGIGKISHSNDWLCRWALHATSGVVVAPVAMRSLYEALTLACKDPHRRYTDALKTASSTAGPLCMPTPLDSHPKRIPAREERCSQLPFAGKRCCGQCPPRTKVHACLRGGAWGCSVSRYVGKQDKIQLLRHFRRLSSSAWRGRGRKAASGSLAACCLNAETETASVIRHHPTSLS